MSDTGQHEPPPPADVLRWVGEAAPGLWYLADVPEERREQVREVVWLLVRAEQLEVGDWVAGRGQGFRLLRPVEPPLPAPDYDPEAIRRPLLSPRPSIVTPLLVVLHVVWFVAGGLVAAKSRAATDFLAGTNHPIIDPILRQTGAVSASTLLRGEWWRLLTSGFVHVGLVHLFGNMVILALLGSLAEAVWGRRRFLLIYLCGGLAGSVTAMAISPLGGSGELVYGTASGGLWGVTAAVLAWMARNLKDAPPLAAADLVRRIVVVGVMNLLVSFAQGVSVAGMVGGAAAGLAVAVCLARLSKGQRVPVAVGGLVLTAVGFVALLTAAVHMSNDWQTLRERVVRTTPPATADTNPTPP